MSGISVGTIYATLQLRQQEFTSGLKAANAAADSAARRMEADFGRVRAAVQGVSTALLAVGVGGFAGLAAFTAAAMEAVESENLFTESLRENADEARKWSETLRKSLGLNSFELRRQVGMWYTMLGSIGLNERAALGMSKRLVELANDMASFYNIRPEEAFEKLRSGIMGEIEPLRQLGIVVDDNTMKSYLLAQGIRRKTETMSQAEKAAIRYELILRQTAVAQGDLARTMDSPANKLRILQAQAKQLSIELGTALLPAFGRLIDAGKSVTDRLQGMDEAQVASIANMALWGLGLTAAAGLALKLADAVWKIHAALTAVNAAVAAGGVAKLAAVASVGVLPAAAVAGAWFGYADLQRQIDDANRRRAGTDLVIEDGQIVFRQRTAPMDPYAIARGMPKIPGVTVIGAPIPARADAAATMPKPPKWQEPGLSVSAQAQIAAARASATEGLADDIRAAELSASAAREELERARKALREASDSEAADDEIAKRRDALEQARIAVADAEARTVALRRRAADEAKREAEAAAKDAERRPMADYAAGLEQADLAVRDVQAQIATLRAYGQEAAAAALERGRLQTALAGKDRYLREQMQGAQEGSPVAVAAREELARMAGDRQRRIEAAAERERRSQREAAELDAARLRAAQAHVDAETDAVTRAEEGLALARDTAAAREVELAAAQAAQAPARELLDAETAQLTAVAAVTRAEEALAQAQAQRRRAQVEQVADALELGRITRDTAAEQLLALERAAATDAERLEIARRIARIRAEEAEGIDRAADALADAGMRAGTLSIEAAIARAEAGVREAVDAIEEGMFSPDVSAPELEERRRRAEARTDRLQRLIDERERRRELATADAERARDEGRRRRYQGAGAAEQVELATADVEARVSDLDAAERRLETAVGETARAEAGAAVEAARLALEEAGARLGEAMQRKARDGRLAWEREWSGLGEVLFDATRDRDAIRDYIKQIAAEWGRANFQTLWAKLTRKGEDGQAAPLEELWQRLRPALTGGMRRIVGGLGLPPEVQERLNRELPGIGGSLAGAYTGITQGGATGGAIGGASAGYSIGRAGGAAGPYGAIIGGIAGLILGGDQERRRREEEAQRIRQEQLRELRRLNNALTPVADFFRGYGLELTPAGASFGGGLATSYAVMTSRGVR